MKINRDLPRQIPRTPTERELAAKIAAREAAEEEERIARSKRATEVVSVAAEITNGEEQL